MQYPVLNKQSISTDISKTKAKVPILLKGSWHVPGFGLLNVTDTYLEKLITNFKSNVLGFKPYATLGHVTDSPDPNSIDGERKRGDLEDIVVENNVAYGIYNINEDTYKLIEKGEYEYSSPEIQHNFRDKTTGELIGPTLIRTALTNAPFMPFNENKIVTLSNNSTSDNSVVYIKLSTNIIQNEIETLEPEITPNTESNNETVTTEVIEQEQVEQPLNTSNTTEEIVVNEDSNIDKEQIEKTDTQMIHSLQQPEVTTPTPSEAPVLQSSDFIKILNDQLSQTVQAINTKVDESIQAITVKTQETVEELKGQVSTLATQLNDLSQKANKVEEHSQYIAALSSSERTMQLNQKLNQAFNNGANPASLKLAKEIITNYQEGNSMVKLSVGANEQKEVSFDEAILSLVNLSVNSVNSLDTQVGSQGGVKETSYFENLIKANKDKATKK